MYILSQILVVFSDLFFIFSMLSKSKPKVLIFLILSTLFYSCHYAFLDAFTGAVLEILDLILLVVLYFTENKYKDKYNIPIVIIFGIATVILSVLTWNSWLSIIPLVSIIIYLVGLVFTNIVFVKSCVLIRLVLSGIYMLLIGSYLGAAFSLVIISFNIYGVVRDIKRNSDVVNNV